MYLDKFYATLVDLCYSAINGDAQAANTIRLVHDHLEGIQVLTGAVYPRLLDFTQVMADVAGSARMLSDPGEEVKADV